jgi:hypothetical protein
VSLHASGRALVGRVAMAACAVHVLVQAPVACGPSWPLSRKGTGSYAKDSGQAVSRLGGRSDQVKDLFC